MNNQEKDEVLELAEEAGFILNRVGQYVAPAPKEDVRKELLTFAAKLREQDAATIAELSRNLDIAAEKLQQLTKTIKQLEATIAQKDAEIERLKKDKDSGLFHPWKQALEGTIIKLQYELSAAQAQVGELRFLAQKIRENGK